MLLRAVRYCSEAKTSRESSGVGCALAYSIAVRSSLHLATSQLHIHSIYSNICVLNIMYMYLHHFGRKHIQACPRVTAYVTLFKLWYPPNKATLGTLYLPFVEILYRLPSKVSTTLHKVSCATRTRLEKS